MTGSTIVTQHTVSAHDRIYRGVEYRVTCALCGEDFTHETTTGRKPIYCPDCAAEQKRLKAAERKQRQRAKDRERSEG